MVMLSTHGGITSLPNLTLPFKVPSKHYNARKPIVA